MIEQAFCSSFKVELLAMSPHTPTDEYRIALYTAEADLNESTTTYSPAFEVVDPIGGYQAGGQELSGLSVSLDGGVAMLDWVVDPEWPRASIAAAGTLIYNASRGNKALAVLDFGGVMVSENTPFKIVWPPATAATALIRIR